MAKKTNVLKLAQQNWERMDVTSPRPAMLPPALYLMQLRLPKLRISPTKKKLAVILDPESRDGFPQFVKIRHIA